MTPTATQIPTAEVRGERVAEMRIDADALAQRFDISWETGDDALGTFRSAALRLATPPVDFGVLVYEDETISAPLLIMSPEHAAEGGREAVLRALGVAASDLLPALDERTARAPEDQLSEEQIADVINIDAVRRRRTRRIARTG